MPSIDDRIVKITFDNSGFDAQISDTLDSLADLNEALQFTGAQQGVANLAQVTGNFSMNNISDAVSNISDKFSTFGAIGFTAIQNITNAAIEMVKNIGGDILEPILTGGTQRAKNIEQAKFMFEGLGIDIQAGMASALAAVQGTAFGLDEAAKAAAQFGASGIKVGDQMTAALRGVAGAAAMTGSSFTEMADIFAGSAGSGKVNNMDLMQFATRGLNAAAAIGPILGKTEQQIHEMAAAGQLDFQTFADAMDKAFGQHATEANKTYTGSLANLHAAMSRLGAAFIAPQLTQQRDLFNLLSPAIDKVAAAIKPLIDTFTLLSGFAKQGIMDKLLSFDLFGGDNLAKAVPNIQAAMVNIFNAIKNIVDIGKDAFAKIFPPGTESVIVRISEAFKNITAALIIGGEGAGKLQSIFQGFFAVLSIGWEVVKEGAKFIGELISSFLGLAGGGIVDFFANLGDHLTNLQQKLVQGGGIKDFFQDLTDILGKVKDAIKKVVDLIHDAFTGDVDDAVGRVVDRFGGLEGIFKNIGNLWGPLEDGLRGIVDILDKVFTVVAAWFKDLGHKVSEAMGDGNFQPVFDVINSALLGGILVLLHNFFTDGLKLSIGGDFFQRLNYMMSQISGIFGELTNTLQDMQMKLKADALMKIAEAIGILTASVLVLSLIDSAALSKALTAMAVGFGELMASFKIFTGIVSDPKSAASFTILAVGLDLLAGAIFGLSLSVLLLSTMDWDELVKGLTGVSVILGVLVLVSKPLAENSPGMIQAGVGIAALAVGLGILAVAMKIFATMDWGELSKGFVGVVGSLIAIGLTMKLMPNAGEMLLISVGLIAVGIAMNILATAMKLFATMSWEEIGKGLVAMAGGLSLIAAAMYGMPATLPITAAGLILVGIALTEIGGALKIFATMSWEQIGKGLVTLAGSLVILAVGLTAMSGTILGSISLVIAANALLVLAAAIKLFGNMSWDDLVQGLLKVASALGAFALISVILSEAVPFMFALGAALVILGVGFALVGAGAYLVAKAFETFAKAGDAGIEMVKEFIGVLTESLPRLAEALAKAFVGMLQVFIDAAPVFAEGIGKLLNILVEQLTLLAPKLFPLIEELIAGILQVITDKGPDIIKTGLFIVTQLLIGIRDNIGPITEIAVDIITNFITALSNKIDGVVDATANLFINYFNSVARALGLVAGTLLISVAENFVEGFMTGLENEVPGITDWFTSLPGDIIGWIGDTLSTLVNKGGDLINGLLNGINFTVGQVTGFFTSLPGQILGWIGDTISTLVSKGSDLLQGLWNGAKFVWDLVIGWVGGLLWLIPGAIGDALTTLKQVGKDIIQGLWNGMKKVWEQVEDWLGGLADTITGFLKNPLSVLSPSRVMKEIGEYIFEGLYIGMKDSWSDVDRWLDSLDVAKLFTDTVVGDAPKAINDSLQKILDGLENDIDMSPVITPVLDLTKLKDGANQISNYIPSSATYSQAQLIAAQKFQDETSIDTANPINGVKFEQNIYAPTQLSPSDIYKQTRNQITMAKDELSIP